MSRPRLLDLFCGAGGASMGYHRAGFAVTGVDLHPQKHYPFAFIRADALAYLAAHGHEYDAIAASPPCQRYTRLKSVNRHRVYPDLVAATRETLDTSGRPYVLENVPGAPLVAPVMLCGTFFGLKVYRHRLFECSFRAVVPSHVPHRDTCAGTRVRGAGAISPKGFVTVTSGGGHTEYKRRAMGIDWMTQNELAQAIPPAYTEHIGRQLIERL
jgi:DNA (cytosine-5)-methyltransferase 1